MVNESVPVQMVNWIGLQHEFAISWHALQALGISRFIELLDPRHQYMDVSQGVSNAIGGCFTPIHEWAKNKKRKRGDDDARDQIAVWEVFRELRPQHLSIKKKIRYARRFWSRLFRIQCMSLKALQVFEVVGVPEDYSCTASFLSFLFSDKMPSLLSRIRNNIQYNDTKFVYRGLHVFDVILLLDLMVINRVHIPVRQPDRIVPRQSPRGILRQ